MTNTCDTLKEGFLNNPRQCRVDFSKLVCAAGKDDDTCLTAKVNGTESLALSETKAAPVAGAVGLFVDIGSESFFANLKITPR